MGVIVAVPEQGTKARTAPRRKWLADLDFGSPERLDTTCVAYARFSDECDVYVFDQVDSLICMDCALNLTIRGFEALSTAQMIKHLNDHVSAGHKVPSGVFDQLRGEADELDASIRAAR